MVKESSAVDDRRHINSKLNLEASAAFWVVRHLERPSAPTLHGAEA